MQKLLLATSNKSKIKEYKKLLSDCGFEIITPAQAGVSLDVEETGHTFEENASLKAQAFAKASGITSLADDSGLEVDALNGEPGVYSARYAGEGTTDEERNNFLLDKLKGVPDGSRDARFRCVIAIAEPHGKTLLCSGELNGEISRAPKGDNGFGYDPVFYLPSYSKTVAQLLPDEKNKISHRGKAARNAALILKNISAKQDK